MELDKFQKKLSSLKKHNNRRNYLIKYIGIFRVICVMPLHHQKNSRNNFDLNVLIARLNFDSDTITFFLRNINIDAM